MIKNIRNYQIIIFLVIIKLIIEMIKLKEPMLNKPKYISTLIPILISVFCIQIHALDGNNITYSQQIIPQNFHLKENLKLDKETDKNYKSFISLDTKE